MGNPVSNLFAIAVVFGLIAAILYLYCWFFSRQDHMRSHLYNWKSIFRIENGLGPDEKAYPQTGNEVGQVGKFTELIETGSISEYESTDKRAQHFSSANPSTSTIEQPGSPSSSEGQRSERNVERHSTAPYPINEPNMPMPGLPGITFIEWQQPSPDNSEYTHQNVRELPPLYTEVIVEVPKSDIQPPK
ncbi:unnamed protein product [Allacma fusca]|uniref:Uncharacterized protein n=1 Tax=Allacma fusca TaxID=39272 RepID=A0A8J2PLK4_9HEXA|nr:unnamed protein product [Allacma fusca]